MKNLFILIAFTLIFTSCGNKPRKVQIQTEFGNMTVELFDSTPKHRDNFVKLVKEGFYDGLLFHRVIKGFMVQGGDPASKGADLKTSLGSGGPGYKIDAEIGEKHFKGRLAAARQGDGANPKRASSGSQFYLVQGRPTGNASLERVETSQGFKYTEEDKNIYNQVGGTQNLDGQYTVFGQVTEGIELIDKIANVKTLPGDRPAKDLTMKIILLD
jgi:peptidyl-prolyl cis-trans isomerase B (cyclophilin B)